MPFNLSKGFTKSFKGLCNYSDLNIYKNMRQKKGKHFDRILWIIICLTLFIFTIFHLLNLWTIFSDNPTVTTLDSTTYPITEVAFPGISICNINKISKKMVEQVGRILVKRTNNDVKMATELLHVVGHFYDFEVEEEKEIFNFQNYFYKSPLKNTSVNEFMKMLTTPCEKLLQKCYWKGNLVECSNVFQMRLTFEGYCCTFNYFKQTPGTDNYNSTYFKKPIKGKAGHENGLTVIINNDLEDYFFTTIDAVGVKVHVFNSKDYPDKNSGSLTEFLLHTASENFIEIIPRTIVAVKDVMKSPIDKRKCVFELERQTKFGFYSESDCLVECRIQSMLALCNCIPFFIPNDDENTVCVLTDNVCLKKYKEKWISFAPYDEYVEELNREHQDALRCQEKCFPACEGTTYDVTTNYAPLQASNGLKTKENDSIIHIFFRDRYSHLYKQDVVYYWFEIVSTFGGIFGLFIGFSLVSVTEILFYFIYKTLIYSWN